MKRDEIKKKFDEIVDFSGVEKFLDTPVKRYSSGMYVRLAFSVAAHLEPEILVVDEVLAVGDAEFQKKCLGKMSDVAKEGRTILFVSHNMSAISSLCDRAIVLEKGRMVFDDDPQMAIENYIARNEQTAKTMNIQDRTDRSGNQKVVLKDLLILDDKSQQVVDLISGGEYSFVIELTNNSDSPVRNVIISLDIYDTTERRVLLLRNDFEKHQIDVVSNKESVCCKLKSIPLATGTYYCSVYISVNDVELLDYISHVGYFMVIGGDYFGTGSNGLPNNCKVLMRSTWSTTNG